MRRWLFVAALFGALAAAVPAQELLPVPALDARVIDQTGTLSAAGRQSIDDQLAALERSKGSQVVVLMVATTQPEDIASYANRVANAWKIGRRSVGDGVLLLVARNDRKLRIEVAKSLEGAIPDLVARRIIDEAIAPRLREGDFEGGLRAGVERIVRLIDAEALPAPTAQAAGDDGSADGGQQLEAILVLVAGVILVVPLASAALRPMLGRKVAALASGAGTGALAWQYFPLHWALVLAAAAAGFVVALLSGVGGGPRSGGSRRSRAGAAAGGWAAGGSSWGGSSSGSDFGSGGGFSPGGGGDFGGGGASGDW